MSIKYWLSLLTLLLLPAPALAHHEPRYGSGDIDPYPHNDERFQVDQGSGLDTGCTFRSGGPLSFKVPIDRYVGSVKADGTLAHPKLLIEQGVISRTAELILPAYDIDLDQGEIDEVYFNGRKLDKPLQGSDGTWHENQFTVPIEWVKFSAARGENGQKPVAAENEIRIDIDINNEGWCTSIDWAQVHFKAMAPLLLIHGIGADPQAAWEVEPGVTQHLTNLGIPFEHRIQIGRSDGILPERDLRGNIIEPGNADALEREIRRVAQSFGVQNVHLVGHSKGGLDSRGYLAKNYNPDEVRVLSLNTISTPHQGSVLADISTAARTLFPRPMAQQEDTEMQNYLANDFYLAQVLGGVTGRGPQFPGLRDLQTKSMRDFNRDNPIPNGVKFYTYGADADLDRDGNISVTEAEPLLPNVPIVGFDAAEQGTVLYHLLRDVSTVTLIEERIPFPPRLVFRRELSRVPTTTSQLNDLAVTDTSSQHPNQQQHFGPSSENRWLWRNHRNVKHSGVMDSILNTIRANSPTK